MLPLLYADNSQLPEGTMLLSIVTYGGRVLEPSDLLPKVSHGRVLPWFPAPQGRREAPPAA